MEIGGMSTMTNMNNDSSMGMGANMRSPARQTGEANPWM